MLDIISAYCVYSEIWRQARREACLNQLESRFNISYLFEDLETNFAVAKTLSFILLLLRSAFYNADQPRPVHQKSLLRIIS